MNLLTTKELAERLDVSPRTIESWRTRGIGPEFIRLGGQCRYRWSAVERWMKNRTHTSTGEVQTQ